MAAHNSRMPVNVSALVAGTAVAVLGSILLGAVYFGLIFGVNAWRGTTPDLDAPHFVVLELLLGPSFTVLGGWVAARMRAGAHLAYGAAVGAASAAIWLLIGVMLRIENFWTLMEVLFTLADVPAGIFGGYLAMRARPFSAARSALVDSPPPEHKQS